MKKLVVSFEIDDDERAERMAALLSMGSPPLVDLVRQLVHEGVRTVVRIEPVT